MGSMLGLWLGFQSVASDPLVADFFMLECFASSVRSSHALLFDLYAFVCKALFCHFLQLYPVSASKITFSIDRVFHYYRLLLARNPEWLAEQ